MSLESEPHFEIAIRESWMERLLTRLQAFRGTLAFHGALSVTDQAVVSGTNFATSIIVGRACGPHELGDYSLGFTLYCLAACVQRALISLPFTYYCNYFKGDEQRTYAGSTLAHLVLFGLATMMLFIGASGVLAMSGAPEDLISLTRILAVSFPLSFLVEFARRFAMARLEMATVLLLDVTTSAIQIGLLLTLASLGSLSAVGAFLAIGVASAVSGLTWLGFARPHFIVRMRNVAVDAKRNWLSGRWILASQLTLFGRASALIWLVALMMDTTSTGIYAACDTLVRLSSPLAMAIANVLFPSAARAFAEGDILRVRRLVRQSVAALCAVTAPFFIIFVFFGDRALAKVYGDAYSGYGGVVALLAFGAIADALDTGAANGLFAIGHPNVHFTATFLGTATTMLISALLIPTHGIYGVAVGSLIGRCLTSIAQWIAFFRMSHPEKVQQS